VGFYYFEREIMEDTTILVPPLFATPVEYRLYVDLDGVLVDFSKQMERIGFIEKEVETDKKAKARFWHAVGRLGHRGEPFWGVMDPMVDAFELWDYIKHRNPEILSATGHVGNAEVEKHAWVKRHLGDVVTHLVLKSPDKAQFAMPHHILIDDRQKSIDPWIAAGGIGILHISANDTIRQLKELGL
jgi:phosphoglycolate phosphatase-like HAD superfamily hydrolase